MRRRQPPLRRVIPGLDPGSHAAYRAGVVYWVYILASRENGTLYTGVTNDLVRRIAEHRTGAVESFTKRYNVKHLVYFEPFDDPRNAIQREKNLKHRPRAWKVSLIEKANPNWHDLFDGISSP